MDVHFISHCSGRVPCARCRAGRLVIGAWQVDVLVGLIGGALLALIHHYLG